MSQFVITLDNKDSKLKCYNSVTVRLVFWCDIWIILYSVSSTFFFRYFIYFCIFVVFHERKQKKKLKTIRKSFNENNFLLGKPDDDAFVVVIFVCRLIDLRIEDLLMKSHDECLFLMRSRK